MVTLYLAAPPTWYDVVPPVLGAEHGEGDGVLDEDGVPVRPVHDGALQPGLCVASVKGERESMWSWSRAWLPDGCIFPTVPIPKI